MHLSYCSLALNNQNTIKMSVLNGRYFPVFNDLIAPPSVHTHPGWWILSSLGTSFLQLPGCGHYSWPKVSALLNARMTLWPWEILTRHQWWCSPNIRWNLGEWGIEVSDFKKSLVWQNVNWTHWSWVTYESLNKTIIGLDNGMSPVI